MSNVIFFALAIGVTILIKFLYDSGKQKLQISHDGGVVKKYTYLIDHLQGSEKPRVFQLDNEIYSFGWVSPNADNRFTLVESFGSVLVKWNFKANIAGEMVKLAKEWRFNEGFDQGLAATKILQDVKTASDEMF